MKLGVFTPVLNDKTLTEALDFLAENGIGAAELGVGTETVKTHTRLIMKKLDVPNTLSAVTTALRLGFIR